MNGRRGGASLQTEPGLQAGWYFSLPSFSVIRRSSISSHQPVINAACDLEPAAVRKVDVRLTFIITVMLFLMPLPAMAWTEADITNGGLHGTLILAGNDRPAPVVLILAGSGPVDRDGNLPGRRNDSLKLLAQGLADRGISSLRIDKRGVGDSREVGLREDDLRFNTYVNDAISWLDVVSAQHNVSGVFVLGHSEGALVATLVAEKKKNVAGLILLAGPGAPATQIIARQLSAAKVAPVLQAESKRISESLARGVAVPDVPPQLSALYRPSVQNYLMSWLPLDPVAELTHVTCPVLIVQGTTDVQITIDDAHRLEAAATYAHLVVIDGMNHVLKNAPADRAGNLATYSDPHLPLNPELVPAIASFIRDNRQAVVTP